MAREEGGEGPQMELGQKHEKTRLPPSHEHSTQGKQRGAGDKGGERKAEREGTQPTGSVPVTGLRAWGAQQCLLHGAQSKLGGRGIRVLAYI